MHKTTKSIQDDSQKSLDQNHIRDLVSRAQADDESAFNELISQFYPIVHRRVWHLVPQNDVEDVTQEVFLAATKALSQFRGDAKFSTWLHTITSRQVANYYRKRERRPIQTNDDIEEISEILPDKNDEFRRNSIDDMITIQRGLARLSHEYQEIILMRLVEGFKFKEIAEFSGISLEATKSRFRRAIKAMRQETGITND